ncbi:MAG: tRNA lysidine(34) synthetase TilS [Pirellulales bacterium]
MADLREFDGVDAATADGSTAKLEQCVASAWPLREWRDCHAVLAVSGGSDSIALLRAVDRMKRHSGGSGCLFIAHLNHGMRGEEAAADAAWLESLCRDLALPFELGQADVGRVAAAQGDGWEAAARTARYEFLQQTAERLGARFVATAHTADDQAETVLHRIIRGTGLRGLAGIPTRRALSRSVTLVRPLLAVRRREVIQYLQALGQDFRIDSSNSDSSYTRNRLRNELLPLLREQFNADVDAAVTRLATQAAEAQAVVEAIAAGVARACVVFESEPQPAAEAASTSSRRVNRITLRCRELRGQQPLVVREVCKLAWKEAGWPLQSMGFSEWQLLASLIAGDSANSRANLPGNVAACRWMDDLVVECRGLS